MNITVFLLFFLIEALLQYNIYTFKKDSKLVAVSNSELNCPLMFTASSHKHRYNQEKYLIFNLVENPNFDPEQGDACRGDMKNIWYDLIRFGKEIESHSGNVKHIHSISFNIGYFPETSREIQYYIDNSPEKKKLFSELDKLKERNLFDRKQFDRSIRYLIIDLEKKYWKETHAPIIEQALSKYDLMIKDYESEKYFYCVTRYNLCNTEFGYKGWPKNKNLDIQYAGPAFDWLSFKSSVVDQK